MQEYIFFNPQLYYEYSCSQLLVLLGTGSNYIALGRQELKAVFRFYQLFSFLNEGKQNI